MDPALRDTVRVKAITLPKEAYPDPVTVRSKAVSATTLVRHEGLGKWLTFQMWGVAFLLVAVLFVLFR